MTLGKRLLAWGLVVVCVGCGGKSAGATDPDDSNGPPQVPQKAGCIELCSESNQKCEGSGDDCDESCADLDRLNEAAGCVASFNSLMSCVDRAVDICSDEACRNEVSAFGSCVTKYCSAHPSDSRCIID